MATSSGAQDRVPLYGIAIPLARPVKLDREAVRAELRAVVALAGAGVRFNDQGPAKRGLLGSLSSAPDELRFEIGGMKLSLASVPKPLCSPTAMHAFINPALWKSGVGAVTNHRAHLMVAEVERFPGGDGRDAMFDRATAVTLAAAAVANACGGEGVVWLPGRNALPLGTFGSEMERFIDGQAPLLFWIRTNVLPAPPQAEREFGQLSGEALEAGLATSGLTAFIGAEIIAPPSHLHRDVMLDHILALASLVIDENKDLDNGLLFGSGPTQIRVLAREQGPFSRRPYWEIEPAKKPATRPVARPSAPPPAQPSPAYPSPEYPSQGQAGARQPSMPHPAPPPGYPPMPDHGLGNNLGLLPKSDGSLVDPEDVLRRAMTSTDPMDALPAALRPSTPAPNRQAMPGQAAPHGQRGGQPAAPVDPMDALPAAHRPPNHNPTSNPGQNLGHNPGHDPGRRAILGPDPAQSLVPSLPSAGEDPDEALPAALRPVRHPTGNPPPMPPPMPPAPGMSEAPAPRPAPRPAGQSKPADTRITGAAGDGADRDAKPSARERPSAMSRRVPKRLPMPDDDHGSRGTDIPRPGKDELQVDTPDEPAAEAEDESIASKLRVVPGSRR